MAKINEIMVGSQVYDVEDKRVQSIGFGDEVSVGAPVEWTAPSDGFVSLRVRNTLSAPLTVHYKIGDLQVFVVNDLAAGDYFGTRLPIKKGEILKRDYESATGYLTYIFFTPFVVPTA